ncbi:MAG TPA: 50S ribosomal protein L21 [Candidatus Dormibacteraeota bacterium]|nr:50S ribosomal protein L21 [Candidatus Dormibacteraeota bacterium]
MYAIVQIGGRQYRAAAGDRVVVDRLDVEPGAKIQLLDVRMLVAEEGDVLQTTVGRPRVDDVSVSATALSHFRGPKMLVFKYKPKKRYRRQRGFRAELTELRIDGVGAPNAEEAEEPATKAPVRRATAKKSAPAEIAAPSELEEAVLAEGRSTESAVKPKRKRAETKPRVATAAKPAAKPRPVRKPPAHPIEEDADGA